MVDDADRIIAAQREEARKTRKLLVWLLVGVPAIGLLSWGVIALLGSIDSTSNDTPTVSTGLTTTSSCSDWLAAASKPLPNAAGDFLSAHPQAGSSALKGYCTANPYSSLGAALADQGVAP